MMRSLLALAMLTMASSAFAFEIGDFRLDAHAGVGYNPVQQTYYSVGLDFYTFVEDHLAVGVGGYYSAGNQPNYDQEIGAGPFVSYSYPLLDFLIPSIREDLDYVNERNPIISSSTGQAVDYQNLYGMASITTVAIHLFFTHNFGIGAGYRFALALNNSDLEKDRSGFIFSLAFAI